jgi:hypothetical protein
MKAAINRILNQRILWYLNYHLSAINQFQLQTAVDDLIVDHRMCQARVKGAFRLAMYFS